VLGQCAALAHLNLRFNDISAAGAERVRALWRGQASDLLFGEEELEIETDEESEDEDDVESDDEDEGEGVV
jgi:hypothetical protein